MGQTSQQGGKNHGLGIFPQRKMKVSARILWNKIATLAEVHFQDLKGLSDLPDYVARKRSRHHVRPLPDKKRILKQIPQSLQRMADCGLSKVQLLTRASDIALAIDGFEDNKQIQINLA